MELSTLVLALSVGFAVAEIESFRVKFFHNSNSECFHYEVKETAGYLHPLRGMSQAQARPEAVADFPAQLQRKATDCQRIQIGQ